MATPTTAPAALYTGEERNKRIFAIVGASSGNLVEWFDFYVYAFCAIYFVSTLAAAGTLANGSAIARAVNRWAPPSQGSAANRPILQACCSADPGQSWRQAATPSRG